MEQVLGVLLNHLSLFLVEGEVQRHFSSALEEGVLAVDEFADIHNAAQDDSYLLDYY